MKLVKRLGRMCLSGVFISGGASSVIDPQPRAAKAEALGLPSMPLAVQANGATMVVAGAALALGLKPRLAAATLAALLIPTTLIGHAFWNEPTPAGRAAHQIHVAKNLGLLGGLLLVLVDQDDASVGG